MPFYSLFVPHQTAGANAVHLDIFNAVGSTVYLKLHSVQPVVDASVAVTGLVSVQLYLTRTSDVGTSGTAATYGGTDTTAATISPLDGSMRCSPSITARRLPTGGATAGAVLSHTNVITEELNAGAFVAENLACPPGMDKIPPIKVPEGTGIRVVQGSVASVGEIGYNVVFETVPSV